MRRWLWISHLQLRAILRIEIKVWEISTEIETLSLEVEFLKPEVEGWGFNPSREPIKAGSVKDQANLAKTLRALRAIKVNLRIRTFRIQSLAAWVQDLVTEMRRRATNNEKKKKTTKKSKKKTETGRRRRQRNYGMGTVLRLACCPWVCGDSYFITPTSGFECSLHVIWLVAE